MTTCSISNVFVYNCRRLGYDDGQKVLEHPFFEDFDLAGVVSGKYVPPYIPAQSFLTGINVGDAAGKFTDPSTFFDSMTSKEEKRFMELFKDKKMARVS